MRGVAFFLLFVAMLPAAFSAAPAAMMLWVWTSLASPQAYVFGGLADLPYSKIVVVVAVLALLVDKGRKRIYVDAYVVFLTLFMLQAALSFAFGITSIDRIYGLADRIWKIYLLCLLVSATLQGRLQIHAVVLAICLGAGIHGVIEGAKFVETAGGHIVIAPSSFGDNNNLGLFMLMTVPLLMYLRRYSVAPIVRLGAAGGILMNLIGVIATGSRGAFIGMIAVTLGMIQQSKRKGLMIFTVVIVGVLLASVAPKRLYERVDTIQTATQDDSFMGRVMSWKMNTILALDRPLTGGGFSAMEDPAIFQKYLSRFGSLSFIPTDIPIIPRAAHSIYFEVLGDMGFSGLFFFLAILVTTFWNLRDIRKATRGNAALQWAFDLAGYLRLTLIAYVISGAALSVVYYELVFAVFTLISVLRKTVRDELPSPQRRPGVVLAGQASARTGRPALTLGAQPPARF